MMTEEQAREKWCPAVRVSLYLSAKGDGDVAGNRPLQEFNCVASDCMWWRWADGTNPYMEDRDELGGYCGMAGKP